MSCRYSMGSLGSPSHGLSCWLTQVHSYGGLRVPGGATGRWTSACKHFSDLCFYHICHSPMAQQQLRFQRWANRLYLLMEGATAKGHSQRNKRNYCGYLGKPQKAMNSQENSTQDEGHSLEKLSLSNIWPVPRLNSSYKIRSHLLSATLINIKVIIDYNFRVTIDMTFLIY